MARPVRPDEESETPLDPAVERVRRKLVRFVAVNLGLLFVALMAVLAAIVYKSGPTPEAAAQAPGSDYPAFDIVLPAGARILSHDLSGDRMSIDIEAADGSRAIVVYDLAQGRPVGRFPIVSP